MAAMDPKKFFGELRRRNVYKVAVAYAVVAWLLVQVATQVFPFFEVPGCWAIRLVIYVNPGDRVCRRAGFFLGVRIDRRRVKTHRRCGCYQVGHQKHWKETRLCHHRHPAPDHRHICLSTVRWTKSRVRRGSQVPEKSIAVLPFENRSEDKVNAYFADGIQDEIQTRLSKHRRARDHLKIGDPLRHDPRFQKLARSGTPK